MLNFSNSHWLIFPPVNSPLPGIFLLQIQVTRLLIQCFTLIALSLTRIIYLIIIQP